MRMLMQGSYEDEFVMGFANDKAKLYKYTRSLSKQDSFPSVMCHETTSVTSNFDKALPFNNFSNLHSLYNISYVLPPLSEILTPA